MISQKARYSFKALIALARRPQDTMQIRDIAEQENIPRSFLEQILLDLKRHRLVGSRRGKEGGYYLAQPASEITLGQILRLSDGPIAPLSCLSRQSYRRCEDCDDETSCALRIAFTESFLAQVEALERTTLAQALARAEFVEEAKASVHQEFIAADI
ncbi:MAG: Rrf2 family transcriptional regulator [Hyphomicrobiales bacterium]|jgi:Rrf2 family protein|nr:Rrf2 family transcriptional regulator [Hyphomicrobiales bacterium]